MSDGEIKLIAKLQFFLDYLTRHKHESEDLAIKEPAMPGFLQAERSEIYNEIMAEYTRVFDAFLYQD